MRRVVATYGSLRHATTELNVALDSVFVQRLSRTSLRTFCKLLDTNINKAFASSSLLAQTQFLTGFAYTKLFHQFYFSRCVN